MFTEPSEPAIPQEEHVVRYAGQQGRVRPCRRGKESKVPYLGRRRKRMPRLPSAPLCQVARYL